MTDEPKCQIIDSELYEWLDCDLLSPVDLDDPDNAKWKEAWARHQEFWGTAGDRADGPYRLVEQDGYYTLERDDEAD